MKALTRWFDVRPGEVRPVVSTFGSLLLIVVAHTVLETVRDTLFLTHIGPKGLGPMYMVAAALTLAVGSVSGGISARFGAARALIVTQIASALGTFAFFFLPPTRPVLMALYAFSTVTGALLVPQLWAAAGGLFHAAQSRRLFGTIAMAGILGAIAGSGAAAAALMGTRVSSLFLLSGAAFAGSTLLACLAPRGPQKATRSPTGPRRKHSWIAPFREEPILIGMAVVVALGAMTTLLVDYAFKSAAVAHIPADNLASFFARYSAIMNVLAFVVQLVIAKRVLARAGVVGTAAFMPSLLLTGSILTFVTGGAMLAVLGTKVVDAALRHSVHRTGTELVYLAVPAQPRNRAKPLIDGAVARISQAIAAGLVMLMTSLGIAGIPHLALVATLSAAAWGAATYALRKPYIALFRRTLIGQKSVGDASVQELDLASVELLVEALASPRPREVVASMNALARRDRTGLIPALVLLLDDPDILERALELFGSSRRRDWIRLAERVAGDKRERVRRAALRALARARSPEIDAPPISSDPALEDRPWIKGYLATTSLARHEAGTQRDVLELVQYGPDAREALLGVLTALGDLGPTGELVELLARVVDDSRAHQDREVVELVTRAISNLSAAPLVPWLIERLEHREARGAVRNAIAALGPAAYEAVAEALRDPSTPRGLRIHLPRTVELFGTQPAADLLLDLLTSDRDGLVRYKALRGLGRVIVDGRANVPTPKLRALARRDLHEHFRLLGLEDAMATGPTVQTELGRATHTLMMRLLSEKATQSLERIFRLLKLCFPDEDIHRVYAAASAGDVASRANAAEFLDALLAPRRRVPEDGVRGLLRLVTDDLPRSERVMRAAVLTGATPPTDQRAAIKVLLSDGDRTMSTLAAALSETLGRARPVEEGERTPSIVEEVARLLGPQPVEAPG